jgi:hypothetical protein
MMLHEGYFAQQAPRKRGLFLEKGIGIKATRQRGIKQIQLKLQAISKYKIQLGVSHCYGNLKP